MPQVNEAKKEISKTVNLTKSSDVGVKIKCRKLSDKQEFKCRASELYRAFTEKDVSVSRKMCILYKIHIFLFDTLKLNI